MNYKIIYKVILALIIMGSGNESQGQEYFTKNGRISFFSRAPVEDISADNNQVISLLNTETGVLRFHLLIKGFHFPKAMMEQHFNSDYLESDRYPSADFNGTIEGIQNLDITKDGTYMQNVKGDLIIHGVTKAFTAPAKLIVKDGVLSGTSEFNILLKDFNIKIPSVVTNNIAEQIQISVSCLYQKRAKN